MPTAGHTFVSDVRMMREHSNGGNRYVLTFVDRKSRLVRVYYLRKKSEVAEKAKQFVSWVRNQRGSYPKKMQSDGGGEYMSQDLTRFCENLGIDWEYTEAYSPEQNGIAERINRTLVDGSLAMLRHAGLSFSFWQEAMDHFVYIKNRTPHSKLSGRRPIDEWNEALDEIEREDLWSVKTFGCRADVYIPPSKRRGGKDGDKVRTCVYLGKAKNRKAEAFYDFDRDKIIYSHAHCYYEDQFPLNPNAAVAKTHAGKGGGILKKKVRFGSVDVMGESSRSSSIVVVVVVVVVVDCKRESSNSNKLKMLVGVRVTQSQIPAAQRVRMAIAAATAQRVRIAIAATTAQAMKAFLVTLMLTSIQQRWAI